MLAANILLPVPLEGLFTYTVPEAFEGAVRFGVRVRVPFGRSRTMVGVVVAVGVEPPEGVKLRPIAEVLDARPVVTESQWRLWQWMADYYLCTVGDVFGAALPSMLKADRDFRPRTELRLTLASMFRGERELQFARDILARSPRQLAAFDSFVELAGWDKWAQTSGRHDINEPTREELMNVSGASAPVIKQLVDRGILLTVRREVGRVGNGGEPDYSRMKQLNGPQQAAYDAIVSSFREKDVTLLHGVTSSGKTEIYIHLIKQTIDQGRQALYLMPEIALTVQMMERLRRVFGNRIAIYHSRYSDAERAEIWLKQLSTEPFDVILGARSAMFLPMKRLGLVIVDEEHEPSYKQQDPAPRYHARSSAIMLAHQEGAKVLLGTATPSAESYHNALTGKYGLVRLSTRYHGMELPEVRVVDVADLRRRKIMTGPLAPQLIEAMRQALSDGRQAMLFQNRRGFAPVVVCRDCGWTPRCQQCDVSLTLHRKLGQMTCHYCGAAYAVPSTCPKCGSKHLADRGYGTEKIEEYVRRELPEARVARMDQDTTRTAGAYARLIDDFAEGRTNVLIGTQMIGKGLDFGRVGVVGIVDADAMMAHPDYRAHEQAFAMMAQVSGRAGRSGSRGVVFLQTMHPEEPLIAQVVANDFDGAYNALADERRLFGYPPFRRIIYVVMRHTRDDVVERAAVHMGERLRQWFGSRVLGPDKPAVARVKSMNIRKIVLKLEPGIDLKLVRQYLRMAQREALDAPGCAALQLHFDVEV